MFEFADRHRGAYSASLRHAVCPFYCDVNGYQVISFFSFSLHHSEPFDQNAGDTGLISRPIKNNIYDQDELLWGAAWLHKASRRRQYREYIVRNEVVLRAGDTINEFGWDNKHAGINVLVSKVK